MPSFAQPMRLKGFSVLFRNYILSILNISMFTVKPNATFNGNVNASLNVSGKVKLTICMQLSNMYIQYLFYIFTMKYLP